MNTVRSSVPPYLRRKRTTGGIMGDVCIALIPPSVAAVYFFGVEAALRLLLGVAAAMTADVFTPRRLQGGAPDGMAAVTGLILALSCPVGIPLWLLLLLCGVAVGVVREPFGGVGSNLFNPAMGARAILLLVFPTLLGSYGADGISAATPLAAEATPTLTTYLLWAVGRKSGSMGETSALMLAVGYAYLAWRRVIRPYVPLLSLAAFAAVMAAAGENPAAQLLSGSILFGAIYIFTDYTGRPTTPWGEAIFAAGAGALTGVFRLYGKYPEGVCFAVLAMNLLTPLLEVITRPRVYGTKKENAV